MYADNIPVLVKATIPITVFGRKKIDSGGAIFPLLRDDRMYHLIFLKMLLFLYAVTLKIYEFCVCPIKEKAQKRHPLLKMEIFSYSSISGIHTKHFVKIIALVIQIITSI